MEKIVLHYFYIMWYHGLYKKPYMGMYKEVLGMYSRYDYYRGEAREMAKCILKGSL